ncbi:MAG: threonine dehydratase, partial [Flavobacteriales bacterium]|nr:threonine dehydratase [Flavobacteriales bacterium]
EPAGALALTGAKTYSLPENASVVVILSGSNNDITRMEEIKERSLLNEGFKHYFLVSFPQRSGALKDFVNDILGPKDDITFFEYAKKHNREKGPVKVGIHLNDRSDLNDLKNRMNRFGFAHEYMNDNPNAMAYFL